MAALSNSISVLGSLTRGWNTWGDERRETQLVLYSKTRSGLYTACSWEDQQQQEPFVHKIFRHIPTLDRMFTSHKQATEHTGA